MFFTASKVIFFLITPSNLGILAGLAGLALLATRRRLAAGLLGFGILGLLVGGLSPLPTLTILPLEDRFPAPRTVEPAPAGIIVLGGGVETALSEARGQFVGNNADERQIAMADLARRFPQARLVFSGGNGGLTGGGVSEAEVVGRYADELGLPRSRLILENRSRNTHENARFTAELVQPKPGERWLLVTSAFHMPRAVGCFRAAGFTVEAYPVDYRTGGWKRALARSSLASEGLLTLDLAVKEWIGLLAYRLSGYTSAWFPGPEASASGSPSR